MESLKYLISVTHVQSGRHFINEDVVRLFQKDFISSLSQCVSFFIRQSFIPGLNKIRVEGSVGVLWRTDGHNREVKVIKGVG